MRCASEALPGRVDEQLVVRGEGLDLNSLMPPVTCTTSATPGYSNQVVIRPLVGCMRFC